MRRWNKLALGALAAALVVPVGASADVIETYEEDHRGGWASASACAWVDSEYYVDMCGWLDDFDGDGEWDSAGVGVYREGCVQTGAITRCSYDYGSETVPVEDVAIDVETGTAQISTTLDGCTVDVTFTGDGPSESGTDRFTSRPSFRLRDTTLASRRYDYSWQSGGADAAGSVCDWFTGEFDDAMVSEEAEFASEGGYRIRPEDAPIVGGAFQRQTRDRADGSESLCAGWENYGGAYEYSEVCAGGFDEGADGTVDSVNVGTYQETCDDSGCSGGATSWTGTDEVVVAVDADAGSATAQGAFDGCALDVTLVGSKAYGGTYDGGRDWPAVHEDGSVGLGSDYRDQYSSLSGEPADGAVVCDWAGLDDRRYRWGSAWESRTETTDHSIRVDPAGIATP